jgi:hypothetical protein
VGGVLSDKLRLAAIIWILIPLAGCALWALRCAVRAWAWRVSFAVGVVTLGLTIAVVVTVVGADGAKVGTGIWICAVGAVMSLVADLFHYIRTARVAR